MDETLTKLWELLGVPQIWGLILTIVIAGSAVAIRLFIKHSLDLQLQKFTAERGELEYSRLHYAGIKDYSTEQAQSLRQAYLVLFESESSDITLNNMEFNDKLELAIECLLRPVRNHLGIIDELTASKMYAVANYLRNFKDNEKNLGSKKAKFYDITEST